MAMETRVLPADDPQALEEAVQLLLAGQVIAHPTDTVYGVAADSGNADAIRRLYEVKERPLDKAIPVLLGDIADMLKVADYVSPAAWKLAEAFWPGGLTLVVPVRPCMPAILTAGQRTIAVRLPDHETPRELARRLGRPIAATSANLSGQPSPATAEEVLAQLQGRVSLVLDGGPAREGIASTIVDVSTPTPRILREGPISAAEIAEVLGIEIA
ncbi:L-threonylcarbamoyladenylate synthase [Ardenticatena maritima]|uniref:L-threonylcarbamoyladenylate synthase n=2 Tax=Ardenticatena maritima TaxID=872965 RepID=A0A0M8K6M1_9CHLR|nr:L-threonylcarbamoyladenylate synthase [Ardenticatena maritima]GAP61861.1 L-threonylcarbamoyladenylate synthase [Ardenticatena maritima]